MNVKVLFSLIFNFLFVINKNAISNIKHPKLLNNKLLICIKPLAISKLIKIYASKFKIPKTTIKPTITFKFLTKLVLKSLKNSSI